MFFAFCLLAPIHSNFTRISLEARAKFKWIEAKNFPLQLRMKFDWNSSLLGPKKIHFHSKFEWNSIEAGLKKIISFPLKAWVKKSPESYEWKFTRRLRVNFDHLEPSEIRVDFLEYFVNVHYFSRTSFFDIIIFLKFTCG